MPLLGCCLFLLLRALGLAAANLTANEHANRQRYAYLNHETAGYCNRFDNGPVANCWQFWAAPQQDWCAQLRSVHSRSMLPSCQHATITTAAF